MRRAQQYRVLMLGGGLALYAIGMWYAWLDDHEYFASSSRWSANREEIIVAFLLAGVSGILIGTVIQGTRLTNPRRAVGGAGMILAAIVLVWLCSRGIDFLGPNVHGWSFGFVFLPLLLVASGIAWLVMAVVGTLRAVT